MCFFGGGFLTFSNAFIHNKLEIYEQRCGSWPATVHQQCQAGGGCVELRLPKVERERRLMKTEDWRHVCFVMESVFTRDEQWGELSHFSSLRSEPITITLHWPVDPSRPWREKSSPDWPTRWRAPWWCWAGWWILPPCSTCPGCRWVCTGWWQLGGSEGRNLDKQKMIHSSLFQRPVNFEPFSVKTLKDKLQRLC